jgi:hypothetical protein
VHAVVLRTAGADDHDRDADALTPNGLDQRPPVHLGEHQVEHAHVRPLVPQSCQCLLPVGDLERIEARLGQMRRHRLGEDTVILDDQHRSHLDANHPGGRRRLGNRAGEWRVKVL